MTGQWGGSRPGAGRRKMTDKEKGAKTKIAAEPKDQSRALTLSAMVMRQVAEASRNAAQARKQDTTFDPFKLPAFPPQATPPENLQMAMDDSMNWASGEWAAASFAGLQSQGLLFLGYPYLSELAQRPEYRIISETIADDSTRKWIDFEITGDETEQDDQKRRADNDPDGEAERQADPDERKKRVKAAGKADKVKALKDDQERLDVRDRFYQISRNDGFFGRSHLYLNFGTDINGDPAELKSPIGNGRDKMSKGKIEKGSFNELKVIEPIWCYPTSYNATNPLAPNWYDPAVWYVMGREIDRSRLLTFVGRPVPDIMKPAYAFGGLSMSQMAMPYVDIWLNTKKSVADLIHSFSVMVLMTDLQTIMQGNNAEALMARVAMFNALRDNDGTFVVNKASEDFKNVSASLAGLHELQAQAQEHIACLPAGILIETDRGQVPIEKVTLKDSVLTRDGFAPIRWVGVTGHSDTLVKIEAGDSVIATTESHPIWSESNQDFVDAKNVSTSHRLLALKTPFQVNTDSPSLGVADGGGRQKRVITEIKKLVVCFIASCGKRIAALSLRVMKSITEMTTAQATAGRILNYLLVSNTWLVTSASTNESTSSIARFAELNSNARLLNDPSIVRRLAEPRLTKFDVGGGQLPTLGHASNAESHSQPSASMHDSALARVCSAPVTDASVDRSTNNAYNVEQSLPPRELMSNSVLATANAVPVTMVSKISVPRQPVYNIEVDDGFLPEFYANGILVHNSIARIPLVKFTGMTPSGLNASSEGEISCYDDTISAYQNRLFRPELTRVVNFEQLSLWGEIDPQIGIVFEPLRVMTEKEKGEQQKAEAERDQIYIDTGVLWPEEVRKKIANDPELPYADLDVEDVPDLREEEEIGGLEPAGGRPDPLAEPAAGGTKPKDGGSQD